MTEPFTPEEILATRVLVGQRSQTSWSPAILANEIRWLATVDALQARLDAAEVDEVNDDCLAMGCDIELGDYECRRCGAEVEGEEIE